MTEEELLRSLGLDKFKTVESLADAYRASEKKIGEKPESLTEKLSELTAAERADLGLWDRKLGASSLEGDLGLHSNRIIAEQGVSAAQADKIVKDLYSAIGPTDSKWQTDIQTFLDSDSSGKMVTDGSGVTTSADRNGEFVERYLKKYSKDPVDFRESLEKGDISLEKLQMIAEEGRRVSEVEKTAGVDVSFAPPDVINPATAKAELQKIYDSPGSLSALYDTEDPDHSAVKTRYDNLKEMVIKDR